jgi:flavin reductase (DIM6/NTAB) family NADH-FMN oxidoreductase RutF
MRLDFDSMAAREAYGWITATVLPRPIAWVSTLSPGGVTNLAPFSFFQGITGNPPTLMFSPVNDRNGKPKDTARNVAATREFVVNLVPFDLRGPMNQSAATLPYEESEFEKFAIATAPSERVKPPRVAAAPVAFECRLHSIVPIGEGPLAARVIFGRILMMHVADAVLGADGKPDPGKLDLIARLGGEGYARTTERFNLPRPD